MRYFPEGAQERHETHQTVGVLVEIRTEHLVKTNQKRNSLRLLPGCVQQSVQVPVSQVFYYITTLPSRVLVI